MATSRCSGTNSQDFINGKFLTTGQDRITLVSPLDKATITSNPVLVWAPTSGVRKYRVEMALDSQFTQVVLDKITGDTFMQVTDSDLKSGTTLDSVDYHWRVSIPYVQENLMSASSSFGHLSAAATGELVVYVNGSSGLSTQSGTKTAPYKTINLAVKAADVLRGGDVSKAVLVRVAQGTYTESVAIPAGISLYGGYLASDWTRNISANQTTIAAAATIALRYDSDVTTTYRDTTVLDGFRITAGPTYSSAAGTVTLTSANPKITNNTFVQHPTANSQSIFLNNGSPQIMNNAVTSSNAGYLGTFIRCDGSTLGSMTGLPEVRSNTITGTGYQFIFSASFCGMLVTQNTIDVSNAGTGIAVNSPGTQSLTIDRNTIKISGAAAQVRGIYADSIDAIVTNNLIFVRYAGGLSSCGSPFAPVTAVGVYSGTPVISNNTLIAEADGSCLAVLNDQNSATFVATNNILIAQGAAGTRYCYRNQANVDVVDTNVFVNCTDAPTGTNSTQAFAAMNFAAGTTYTFGFDAKLTASSPAAVLTGGKNTGTSICGAGANATCGSVTLDRDGLSRTISYSIGAYELD